MAPRQLLRQYETRTPESYEDQKTPAEISQAEIEASNLNELTGFLISQIRQILGTPNWYDPVPDNLQNLADAVTTGVLDQLVFNEEPTGVKDGTNLEFTTTQSFKSPTLRLYFNGQRLVIDCDFEIIETAGDGTGVRFLDPLLAPGASESVLVDYVKA